MLRFTSRTGRRTLRAWSVADMRELRTLVARRTSVHIIAERLGRTPKAVRLRIERSGIRLRQVLAVLGDV